MSGADSAWLNDAFTSARDDFLSKVKDPDKYDFAKLTTIDDVYDATDAIQKEQSNTKTLRGLGRISPFLEALKEFSAIIEVFVQVKPDVLALIWGPLKFLLQISSTISSLFGKVITVVAEFGDSLPLFKQYAKLFKQNGTVKNVLRLFYTELLEFYGILVNFMHHRRSKTFLETFWPSVRSKISVVEGNIKGHKALLTDHVTLEHILQSAQSRERAMQEYERSQEFRTRQDFAAAREEFKPSTYHGKLDEILQNSSIESGNWLPTRTEYNKWVDLKDSLRRCLWLQGIPGCGKTFLTANTIRRIQQSAAQVLFVFLVHDDQSRGRVLDVFTSILFQAATRHEAVKARLLEEIRFDSSKLLSNSYIQKLTADTMSLCGPVFIAIDGIDEIEEPGRKTLLEAALGLLDSSPNIKLLLSSRAERDIEKTLCDRAVSLKVDAHNQEDIHSYTNLECQKWVNYLKEDCGADEGMLAAAHASIQRINCKSGGMFLYTKLVLQLLRDQGTTVDIRNELESLPDGLDQAYGRILKRIDTQLSPSQKALARKVLEWVSCSLRPLREEDLLQALVVEPSSNGFRKGKRFHADIRRACGTIIEVVNGKVRFVHFSAKEYITDERIGFLDQRKATLNAAIICSSYLCYGSLDVLFDAQTSSEDVQLQILDKEFVFFDYAANKWLNHVSHVETYLSTEECDLTDILAGLLETRDMTSTEEFHPPSSMLEKFVAFKDEGDLRKTLAISYMMQGKLQYGELVENDCSFSKSLSFKLFNALQSFRSHLEDLYCPESKHKDECRCPELHRSYGPPEFFCRKPFCTRYHDGFPTRKSRDAHLKTHQRPFMCPRADCLHSENGFLTQAQLESHERIAHQELPQDSEFTRMKAVEATDLKALTETGLHSILEDAIVQSDLATLQVLRASQESLLSRLSKAYALRFGSRSQVRDYYAYLSAWKSDTETLEYLLEWSPSKSHKRLIRECLAIAIEADTRPNIKYLLSFKPSLTTEVRFQSTAFDKTYSRKERFETSWGLEGSDILSRALSLWDPDLMEYLTNECHMDIPDKPRFPGGIFSRPAIRGLEMKEISERFETMRRYLKWPRVFHNGVPCAAASMSPTALQFCLENGGNPDPSGFGLGFVMSRTSEATGEMAQLFLRHGANPARSHFGVGLTVGNAYIARRYGVSWEEFVRRAVSGEVLVPIRNGKPREED